MMLDWKRRYFVLGGFVTLLTMITLSSRPVHAGEFDQAKLAEIRTRMQAFVEQGELAGCVTVVGRKDAILSLEAVGHLTIENGEPMPKDALFRIASMTKPITAIGI